MVARIAKVFDSEVHIIKVTGSMNEGVHNKLKMYATQVKKFFDEQGVRYQSSLLIGDNISDSTIEYARITSYNVCYTKLLRPGFRIPV